MKQLAFDFYKPPTGKICTKCHKWKPFNEFRKHPDGFHGRNSRCKDCLRRYEKNYYRNNRAARKAYSQEWYKNNRERAYAYRRENRERIHKYNKIHKARYYAENREKCRAYSRKYYAKHRDERLAYYRKWAAENRDKIKANKIRYRTRKANNDGSFTAREWQRLCEKYENKCLCCGSDGPLEADHIIPVSKGGSSNIDNIQPLCRACNLSKHKHIIDYR